MKKILAVMLTCMMLMSLTASVFAEGQVTAKEQPYAAKDPFSVYSGHVPAVKEDKKEAYKSDGMFYLYVSDATTGGPGSGMTAFDLSNGKMQHLEYGFRSYIVAGTYVFNADDGGAFYGIYTLDRTEYVLARFDDVEFDDHTDISKAPEQILALTADYAHNVVYALGRSFNLYVVNLKTGTFTQCSKLYNFDRDPMVMTVDDIGTMYTITLTGNLYTVNPSSGLCTRVGKTGIEPNYMQYMTYDYNNREIYWFYFTEEGKAGLCSVNRETAETAEIYSFNGLEVMCAYSVPSHIDMPTESAEITGLELNVYSVSLIGGDTVQLDTIIKPLTGFIADRTVTWTVDDDTIASVSKDGLVTALDSGLAVVKARTLDGKYTAECEIFVESAENHYRTLNSAMNTVESGESGWYAYRTDGEIHPFGVQITEGRGIYAKSGNAGAGNSSSWIENVFPVHMAGGGTVTFEYKVSSEKDCDRFIFSVNGENVFAASGEQDWTTYTYTVPKTGDYTFRWTYEKNGSVDYGSDMLCIDNVAYALKETADMTGITLTPAEVGLVIGARQKLETGFTPINAENGEITFTSSNPSVASVNSKGIIIARSNGTAEITATCGKYTAKTKVTVAAAIDIPQMSFKKVSTGEEYAVYLDGAGAQYVNHNGTVKSAVGYSIDMAYGDAAIFSVSPGVQPASDTVLIIYDKDFNQLAYNDNANENTNYSYLKFIPDTEGTYYIVLTTSASYLIDGGDVVMRILNYEPIHITGITVPEEFEVGLSRYAQLHAELLPNTNDYPRITYKSSDESVVTVDENGTLYGVAEGKAVVTATSVDGNHSASSDITVRDMPKPDPDGKVYAYVFADRQQTYKNGFLQYDPMSGEFEQVSENEGYTFYSGMYLNGVLYGYDVKNNFTSYTVKYVMLDALTFTVQYSAVMEESVVPVDMTYDYTTDTVYASVLDMSTQANYFATLDIGTGKINIISRFSEIVLNIEATDDGTLYAIASDGGLYEIDITNGRMSFITGMTVSTNYVSGMTYDHESKLMYWFPMTSTGYESYVISFDPETGDFEVKDPTGSIELTFAFTYYNQSQEQHTVEFLGLKHEVVDVVTVKHGRAAEAPDMTHPDGVRFGMWDKDFSAVTEDMQVQGYYMGDANMNAESDAGDATVILRCVVGITELNENQMYLADVNDNGGVDAADATILLRYIVGMGWQGK